MKTSLRHLICILIFASASLSCVKQSKPNEIRTIELMRVGSWSDEGAIISIDSTLTYRYLDRNKKQNYIGVVSQKLWDTINRRLGRLKFKTANFPAYNNCQDCPVFKMIIKWDNNRQREFYRALNDPRDTFLNTLLLIDTSYQFVRLKAVDSSFKFQMRYPLPPETDIKIVHFPPPLPKPRHKIDR